MHELNRLQRLALSIGQAYTACAWTIVLCFCLLFLFVCAGCATKDYVFGEGCDVHVVFVPNPDYPEQTLTVDFRASAGLSDPFTTMVRSGFASAASVASPGGGDRIDHDPKSQTGCSDMGPVIQQLNALINKTPSSGATTVKIPAQLGVSVEGQIGPP